MTEPTAASMNPYLPELLQVRLTQTLPGPMVGSRFAPPHGQRYSERPADMRQAAVLILLYPSAGRWCMPLTLRPSHLPDHAGQISLPGGAMEPGEAAAQAAIREFYEELGAAGHAIRLLGPLSPIYVHASNFRIEPWVGSSADRPAMAPNPAEVEKLLEVPVAHLRDPANFGCHPRRFKGASYDAPHFDWQGHHIWGATCMILGEFVTVMEELRIEV